MKRCIICREERSSFSDEHVIPKALGGFYHVYSVCKSCNSRLGEKVDSKLVNHKFAEFQRMIDGLKGRSGQLPNPFSGKYTQQGDENRAVRIRLNEKGQFVPYIIPKICHVIEEDGTREISVSIDASIDKREFRKLHQDQVAEEVYGTPEIRFQYHSDTYEELLTFQRYELRNDFYFYTENNRHPVFDKFGNRKNGFVEDEVLKSGGSLGAYEQTRGGGFSQTIALNENEDVYVKIMPSEMLIRVVAIRFEYSRRAKL